jgi:uncharacterized membrane protein
MATVQKTIHINAPVEKVYGYVDIPTNAPEYWPSLVDVRDVEPLPNGGQKYKWTYKMAGMRLEGSTEDTERIPNQRTVGHSKGGIESVITWGFQPEDGGTRVTFNVDYKVPIPVLGKLAEAMIVRQNEREAETLLENLKARMEG